MAGKKKATPKRATTKKARAKRTPKVKAPQADEILAAIEEKKEVLLSKNAAYGGSALAPPKIFSRGDPEEQLRVQIDHKIARILRGKHRAGYDEEDTLLDLENYITLLRIELKRQAAKAAV